MSKSEINQYSVQEKEDAVSQVVLTNTHPSQVASKLGISLQELFEWVNTLREKKIKYWSIGYAQPKPKVRHGGEQTNCRHGIPPSGPKSASAYTERSIYLKRPNEKPCVAIILKNDDGTIELNPRVEFNTEDDPTSPTGWNYGPIPPLDELTIEQAKELWSTKENNLIDENGVCQYKLVSTTNEEVILELIFIDSTLAKYRVQNKSITSDSKWCNVKNEEEV